MWRVLSKIAQSGHTYQNQKTFGAIHGRRKRNKSFAAWILNKFDTIFLMNNVSFFHEVALCFKLNIIYPQQPATEALERERRRWRDGSFWVIMIGRPQIVRKSKLYVKYIDQE